MTKVVKLWQRFSFWNKLKLFLVPISIGGTLTVYMTDANKGYYLLAPIAYVITHLIETFIKDEDGDNRVDPL